MQLLINFVFIDYRFYEEKKGTMCLLPAGAVWGREWQPADVEWELDQVCGTPEP